MRRTAGRRSDPLATRTADSAASTSSRADMACRRASNGSTASTARCTSLVFVRSDLPVRQHFPDHAPQVLRGRHLRTLRLMQPLSQAIELVGGQAAIRGHRPAERQEFRAELSAQLRVRQRQPAVQVGGKACIGHGRGTVLKNPKVVNSPMAAAWRVPALRSIEPIWRGIAVSSASDEQRRIHRGDRHMDRRRFIGYSVAAAVATSLPYGRTWAAKIAGDVAAVRSGGGATTLAASDLQQLKDSLRGALLLPGRSRLRRRAARAQPVDRQASCADHAAERRRGRPHGRGLRAREGPAAGRQVRRAQLRRQVHLRRRHADRPVVACAACASIRQRAGPGSTAAACSANSITRRCRSASSRRRAPYRTPASAD